MDDWSKLVLLACVLPPFAHLCWAEERRRMRELAEFELGLARKVPDMLSRVECLCCGATDWDWDARLHPSDVSLNDPRITEIVPLHREVRVRCQGCDATVVFLASTTGWIISLDHDSEAANE
ncbi:MAG: hypothetical protein ACRDD1_09780 [Planctomycetia bacterium]